MTEHGSQSPHLDPEEQKQASDHAPLKALVIHEIVRAEGEVELRRSASQLLWSGLAAGLSMGFSFMAQALLKTALPDAPWSHPIASLGYVVGFAVVVLGRQQLFTESTLSAALPVLTARGLGKLGPMLRLWGLVLAANIVGTWLFAAVLAYASPLAPETQPSLQALAAEALGHPFWPTFVKAVFAGWLIALMVWLLPTGGPARILIIALLTWAVALGRFSHIIAGSAEGAYAVLTGHGDLLAYGWRFFLPTLIGNTLGGAALVAMLNHAPLSEEVEA